MNPEDLRKKLILQELGEFQETEVCLSLFLNLSEQIFPFKKCGITCSEKLMSFLCSHAKCWLGGISQYCEIRSRKVPTVGEWREAVVKLDRTSYCEHHHEVRYRSVFSILMQMSPMKKLESKEPRRSELQILFMFPPLRVLDQATWRLKQTSVVCFLICSVEPHMLLHYFLSLRKNGTH